MASYLTEAKKRKWLPKLIIDQNGFICYQCDDTLKPGHYVFEHLNDRREDSRYENTGLACIICNNKKPHSIDMQLKARELLKKKEEAGLKYLEDEGAHENNSSEIEINKILYNFTEQYISEQVAANVNISKDETLAELTYLGQERFGHGSESTFRKYLKSLTCKIAKWQVVLDDKGKKIICKRNVLN